MIKDYQDITLTSALINSVDNLFMISRKTELILHFLRNLHEILFIRARI